MNRPRVTLREILGVIVTIPAVLLTGCVARTMRQEEARLGRLNGADFREAVRADGRAPAVLLLHGYGGTPYDIRPLTDALAAAGIAHYAPPLPGHERTPREMASVEHEAWLAAVKKAYRALKEKYGRVSVVGFSMGGALGIWLATEVPVERLVVVNPYFRVRRQWYYLVPPEAWARVMHAIVPFVRKPVLGRIADPQGLARYKSFAHIPVRTTIELQAVGRLARRRAKRLTTPTLWIHAEHDFVADFDTSRAAFETVPADDATFVGYARSDHVLFFDYDAGDAVRRILECLSPSTHPPTGDRP